MPVNKLNVGQDCKNLRKAKFMSLERELPDLLDTKCTYNGSELNLQVELEYSGNKLFEGSSISLQHGHVYGLVGPNGAGKSSFLDILESKTIPGFPKDLSVTLVRSDRHFDAEYGELAPKQFLQQSLQQYSENLSSRVEKLETQLENAEDEEETFELAETLSRLYDVLDSLNMDEEEKAVDVVLEELGFSQSSVQDIAVRNLSGGWRMKCQLAKAAMTLSDLLLVDEPSFLDVKSTGWLLKFLKQAANRGSIIILTSHKEVILEGACDRVLHINASKQLKQFNGTYESFRNTNVQQQASYNTREGKVQKKEEAHARAVKSMRKKIVSGEKKLQSTIQKNGADQRFIKGRSKEKKQRAGKSVAVRAKQLKKDKAELETLRQERAKQQKLHISGKRLGSGESSLVAFNDVSFTYHSSTSPLLENIDLSLSAADRVSLVGANGTGKSTLVKLIIGELEPTCGSVKLFMAPRVVYFPQSAAEDLKLQFGELNAIEYLSQCTTSRISNLEARQHLGGFGLKGKEALRKIIGLSTGQRARLYLAKEFLLHPEPNLLILDEVSDNLDVETVKLLVKSLNDFPGAIIAISHQEEDFLLGFSTKTWSIENGKLKESSSED